MPVPGAKRAPTEAYRGCMDRAPIDPIDELFPEPDDATEAEHAPPRPIDRFRTTAVGAVVAAGLLGLRDALAGKPEREEITIVSEAPTRPVDDHEVQVIVDEETKTVKLVLPRSNGNAAAPNG
jgi:hypothetical protein